MTTLRMFSGGAAHGLVKAMTPALTAATGATVDGVFGAVGGLKNRVLAGEKIDLVILTDAIVAELEGKGLAVPGASRAVGNVETAVAVRAGSPKLDIATADGLRRALRAASAIFYPDPELATAGIHFANVLRRLDIFDETAARHRRYPNGATAMAALAASTEANPIGSTQTTEIVSTPGVTLVGSLPAGYDLSTTYTAALMANATNATAARWLIDALAAPAHADLRRSCGFA